MKDRQLDLLATSDAALPPTARAWLERAAHAWTAVHDRPMTAHWPRDAALIAPLLRLHGPDELAARWCACIETLDPFLARKGWDVPTFAFCVDRYAGDHDRAEKVGLRALRPIRNPITGAILGQRRGW
jgi:hypothetical protein